MSGHRVLRKPLAAFQDDAQATPAAAPALRRRRPAGRLAQKRGDEVAPALDLGGHHAGGAVVRGAAQPHLPAPGEASWRGGESGVRRRDQRQRPGSERSPVAGEGGDAPRQPGPRDGKPGPTGSARASHRRRKKPGHRARSSAPGAMPRPGRFMAEGGRPSGVSHESPAAPPSPERGLSATGSFVRHFSVRAVQGLPAVTRQTARASCIAAICSGE